MEIPFFRYILPFCIFSIVLFDKPVFSKQEILPQGYALLKSVRLPQQLISPFFPTKYTVPISLSGNIANEMRQSLTMMNLEPPQYEEVFDKKGQFHLYLSNASYSLETRDLLVSALNPIDMIDAIITSVIKYRSETQFNAIVHETAVSVSPIAKEQGTRIAVELVPKGNYFSYSYEDEGPFVRESWLTKISCLIDTSTHLLYELKIMRHMRTFSADKTEKPPVDSVSYWYSFSYTTLGTAIMPSGLSLSVNSIPSLTLSATYRTEGKNLVFNTRSICYLNHGSADTTSCLYLNYGTYSWNAASVSAGKPGKPAEYALHMEKAASLCRNAQQKIKSGNIEASIPLLKKVVAEYGETPQAVEARKLLMGLPGIH